jgi:hypothetical protein
VVRQDHVDYFSDSTDGAWRSRAAFHAVARPLQYGSNGVRHYYVDESGIMRGAPTNRDATRDDPPIPECEWAEGRTCSQNN